MRYDVVMIQRVLLAVLALGPVFLSASDTPTPPDMLKGASQQAALLSDSDRPFVMDVDFTVQLNPPMQGQLRLRWEAKDRWWSRVSMGKFEQIKFQKGESTYTLRNVYFTPKQIDDLMGLIRVGEVYQKLMTRAEKQRIEGGVRLDCMEAQNPDPKFKREHFEVCVDSTTHDIVAETRRYTGYASDDVYGKQFSDFVNFGGHRYPRKFESLKDGHLTMSASVTQLQESPLDPKLLVPPPGAIERRECPDKKPPEVLDQPTPNYDPRNHGKTETDAQVTVLTDGTIGNVQIVGSADRAHDNLVMEALKKWKFKPAMCGADPVVADIYVSLVFETPFIR
jgi:TonB family protein